MTSVHVTWYDCVASEFTGSLSRVLQWSMNWIHSQTERNQHRLCAKTLSSFSSLAVYGTDRQTDRRTSGRRAMNKAAIIDVSGASRDSDDNTHLSSQTNVATHSVLGIVRICSGLSYDTLKTALIYYHCARMGYSDCSSHSQSALN